MNADRVRNWSATVAALLLPLAAQGQQEARTTVRAARASVAASAGPKWLEQTIDIDISKVSILDGIKAVLAAAKVNVEGVESELEIPKDTRITLIASRVKTRDALAAIARLGGALAYVSDSDGKVTIQLRKRTDAGTVVVPLPTLGSGGTVGSAFSGAFDPGTFTSNFRIFTNSSSLPNSRVSIDRRHADLRDSLRDILKQAKVDFALEDDIPEDIKKSFTFEDVLLRDALNVICESSEVGWRTETSNGKTLVRIGKKYVRTPNGSR